MIKKLLIGLVALLILAGGGILVINRGMGEIREMSIDDVDLKRVPDGVYPGDFSLGRWSSAVEVAVENHKIVGIEVVGGEQKNILKGAAEKVIQTQSLQVDAYSGASITSKALLKAVETALLKP